MQVEGYSLDAQKDKLRIYLFRQWKAADRKQEKADGMVALHHMAISW